MINAPETSETYGTAHTFFDNLEEIVPSFSSKNVDEKFSFIMECKDYDISCVCITNICIMFRAREELVKSISAS